MSMESWPIWIYVYHLHAVPEQAREGAKFTGVEVTEGCCHLGARNQTQVLSKISLSFLIWNPL